MDFPNIPTSLTGASLIIKAVAGVATLALIGLAVWFVIFRPAAVQQDAADARSDKAVATSQAGAAKENTTIIIRHRDEVDDIDDRTENASNDIHNAPGAGDEIDPDLHRAGIDSLCLHDGNSDRPACESVFQRDGFGLRPR
ncbi:hypothetical protein [Croceicoccus naphthovorans]|uniref:Uncharacterized protein n=1 Tax=Croceicoccus naphthovorans TaxID=1348774 RepID=A0A0G3XG61_9SPHN|nr:hypothetical protein [Croceicoccus naphthovorans]AKM09383.1 hypothetical protein AB433_04310 [Croceicoccus naphthovorans]MBB3990310.1 hypothetical protein [Croceicoccus naphthovorans]